MDGCVDAVGVFAGKEDDEEGGERTVNYICRLCCNHRDLFRALL